MRKKGEIETITMLWIAAIAIVAIIILLIITPMGGAIWVKVKSMFAALTHTGARYG